MAEKEIYLSAQKLKEIFPLDDSVKMMKWLRDNCHTERRRDEFGRRRSNSYKKCVLKWLVDQGYTVAPNFIDRETLRYEDPHVIVPISGIARRQTPGPYNWKHVSIWARENGYNIHREFMYDKEGNKYMCLAWKQFPHFIRVLTNKGFMYAGTNGVLRPHL
jgi:hypothetical protein